MPSPTTSLTIGGEATLHLLLHCSGVFLESKSCRCLDDTHCVSVTFTSTPALDTNHGVSVAENAEPHGFSDAPFQTAIDIFLPGMLIEVGLFFREDERVDSTVQMRILQPVRNAPDDSNASIAVDLPERHAHCGSP
jgi:hypothetical protein